MKTWPATPFPVLGGGGGGGGGRGRRKKKKSGLCRAKEANVWGFTVASSGENRHAIAETPLCMEGGTGQV